MNRLALLASLSFFLLLSAAVAQQPSSEQPAASKDTNAATRARESSAQLRQKTFEVVWRTVKDKYFDPTFGGLDWNKVRERYAPQAAAAKSDRELYGVISSMLGELQVSHLGIASPETISAMSATPGAVGIEMRMLGGLAVITRVAPNSPAASASLRPGFVIRKIDETPIDNPKFFDEALEALSSKPGTKVRLTYWDERDQEHEATLERKLMQTESDRYRDVGFHADFESKRLTNGIGYIRFSQFISSLNKKIRAAILSMHDAPGLIIDLRGNGGGDDEVGIKLASLLFAKRTVLMITKTRKGDDDYYQARPEKQPFLAPVVILQDELSGSASEQFAAGMQESGRAFVIGLASAGDDLDADLKKLPTGAYLVYPYGQPRTPKGVVIEARGVIPDKEVKLTHAELLAGVDAQLDAAIKYIQLKAR